MATTVTYKGETLTTVTNQTKTLKTAGKYMEDDVTITDTSSGGGGQAIIHDTTDSAGGTIREITTDTEYTITSLEATHNGTYTAPTGTAYDSVTVNVSGGGIGSITQDQDGYLVLSPNAPTTSGLEYETGTWTPSEDIARGTISFTNTHTTAPVIVEISDVEPSTSPTDSNRSMVYYNIYALHGGAVYINDTSSYYGLSQYVYITSSGAVGGSRTPITTTTGNEQNYNPGYWADSAAFYPSSNTTTRYWRAGRTYKWIAVWAPTT